MCCVLPGFVARLMVSLIAFGSWQRTTRYADSGITSEIDTDCMSSLTLVTQRFSRKINSGKARNIGFQ